jgi:hypothetical protein
VVLLLGVGLWPAGLARGAASGAYRTEASLPPAQVCVGATAPILVRVIRALALPGGGVIPLRQNNLWVNGTVQTPAVGALVATRQQIPPDAVSAREVRFDFVAVSTGTAQITFVGEPPGNDAIAPVQVEFKVVLCQAHVSSTTVWALPGTPPRSLVAVISRAALTGDVNGHFSGSAAVQWLLTAAPTADCAGQVVVGSSTATLSGDFADEQLGVRMTFDPADLPLDATCPAGVFTPIEKIETVTPAALAVMLPPTGGALTLAQNLTAAATLTGTATLVVQP